MTPPDFDKLAEEYFDNEFHDPEGYSYTDQSYLRDFLRRVYEMGVEAGTNAERVRCSDACADVSRVAHKEGEIEISAGAWRCVLALRLVTDPDERARGNR